MGVLRKNKRILLYLVFPALCFLLYNNTVNLHSHYIKGDIISHAHPYQKNADTRVPFQNHKHSGFEIFILNQIFHFFQFVIGFLGLTFLLAQIRVQKIYIPSEDFVKNIYHLNCSLRAPPFSF
ncbi:MAG: hypothetical protein JW833_05070 [Prolixibacteraceae bacterium]|nr:hypothetical protein [Prolixibacteraceae bacterium]